MTVASSSDSNRPASRPLTLDEIFLRSVARRPDAPALIDPPDRTGITGHAPRRLTYAEADRAVSALAGRFIETGLMPGAVIAAQLPNTVEAMIAMLAALRAGLVIALLPQLWRLTELSDALNRVGAQALVTMARIDGVNHADLALRAAASTFSVGRVHAFGNGLPDGVSALDDIFDMPTPAFDFPEQDARNAAIITFDVTRDGLRVVPRTQLQLSAGGLAVTLEAHLSHGAPMLSAMMPSSFAGLCVSFMTWLLNGGALVLHHPFDAATLLGQLARENCATLVAPSDLLTRLDQRGDLAKLPSLRDVLGLWRLPGRALTTPAWRAPSTFTDVHAFGEAGLVAARRGSDGLPAALFPETSRAARPQPVGEIVLTRHGTLGLRGAMAPLSAYASPIDDEAAPDHIDTGYPAALDRRNGAIVVHASPIALACVGGYRFAGSDLARWAERMPPDTTLTAMPDDVSGFRLTGRSPETPRVRMVLTETGVNPLLVEAFRDRTA